MREKRATVYDEATARIKRTFLVVALFSAAVNILMLTGPMGTPSYSVDE